MSFRFYSSNGHRDKVLTVCISEAVEFIDFLVTFMLIISFKCKRDGSLNILDGRNIGWSDCSNLETEILS